MDRRHVASWLVREMAAVAEQPASADVSSESAARVIDDCAELLSRFWPMDESLLRDAASASLTPAADGDPTISSCDPVPHGQPGQRLGRFEVRRTLGYGGFGIVFLVFDPRLNREAALKIPRPEILVSPVLRQRFLREAQAAAVLDHPGIVPIYETGEIGPVGYILSAYCKGPTLATWLTERQEPIGPPTAAQIVERLAEAVHHAHSRGVLHRDIKPSNILLEPITDQRDDHFPFHPRLSDFGLAKRLDAIDDETRRGTILGTPRYMAPEQAAGDDRNVGVQTDVYALGVILYELLAGEPPLVGQTDAETLREIQEQAVSGLKLRHRCVPRDLETICLKCLEKDQAGRYQSAHELAEDLRRFLAGEVVLARPVGQGRRFVRWCRRRPLIAAMSLSLIVAVTLGGATATWQWLRAEQNLTDARAEAKRAAENLGQAENTLLDLSWMIEESALWAQESSSFRGAVQDKFADYEKHVAAQRGSVGPPTPMLAVSYSFAARNAALAGDSAAADLGFRRSLDVWREIVAANPERADYQRGTALCLFNYLLLLRKQSQATDQSDGLSAVRTYVADFAKRDPLAGRSLSAVVSLLLERGNTLYNDHRMQEALDAQELGLVAALELRNHSPQQTDHLFLVGQLWRLVGNSKRRLRDGRGSVEALNNARQVLEQLVELSPDNQKHGEELAETYRAIGVRARETKDSDSAVEPLESAVVLCEKLVSRNPADNLLHVRLAGMLRELGIAQLATGQKQQSLGSFARCRRVWQEAHQRDGGIPDHALRNLAYVCHQAGMIASDLGDHPSARRAFADATDSFRLAADRMKLGAKDDIARAECHMRLGTYQREADETEAAIQSYEQAIKLLEQWAKQRLNPKVTDWYDKSRTIVDALKSQQAAGIETNGK
ncbi:MAG: serine/threonine-protein kinase [Pirellulales bacterium]